MSEDLAPEEERVTKTLQYFPQDDLWQRTLLLYLRVDTGAPWLEMDQKLIYKTFTKGMTKTSKSMRDELDLNRFVNQAGEWTDEIASSWRKKLRREQVEGSIDTSDDEDGADVDDDGDVDLRESTAMAQTATFGGSVSRNSRYEPGAEPLLDLSATDETVEDCGQKATRLSRDLCTGKRSLCTPARLWFLLNALAGFVAVAGVVFYKRGCCSKWLDGAHDGWPDAARWKTAAAWQNEYHLRNDSCVNVNLQREQNCTVSCSEGYIFSEGDIAVQRSNVFTCGGRYQWDHGRGTSVYERLDGIWDGMFAPKWHFNNWIARGPWADFDHVQNETDKTSWYSRFWPSGYDVRKTQAHPFCWKDPCYHPDRLINPLHTACGENTTCERVCEDLSKPNVSSPGSSGGQQLCGNAGDKNGIGKKPYNFSYPSKANCSCVGDTFERIGPEWASWPEKPNGGGCKPKAA